MTKIITRVSALLFILSFSAFAQATNYGYTNNTGANLNSYPSPGTGSNPNGHYVDGYTRQNGTEVQGHMQSNGNNNFNDNWSTKGNTNPYNNQNGTRTQR